VCLLIGILAAAPAPHDALWRYSVGASAFGVSFLLPALACAYLGRSWVRAVSVVAAVLMVWPIARVVPAQWTVADRVEEAFAELGPAEGSGGPSGLLADRVSVEKEQHTFAPGLEFDFFRPSKPAVAPLLVVVHGGSWRSGKSSQFSPLNKRIASRGVAVASLNYRKAPEHPFPAARDDVVSAVAWLRSNASQLGVDPSRLVLMGRSAGGQLAMSAVRELGDPAQGLVLYYAPVDLLWAWENPSKLPGYDSHATLRSYLGGTPSTLPRPFRAASPLLDLDAAPPTLILHGDGDRLVSPVHSQRLDARLTELGVPHYFVDVPGGKHAFDANLGLPTGKIGADAVESFLDAVFSPR
jgi:acetyl esterase/lipase